MDSLRIRDITSTDCGQILKLIKELAGDKEVKVSKSDLDKLGFNDKYGAPSFLGVVAQLKEETDKSFKIVGVALYHRKYSTWEGPVMHLNTFVVTEKYRGQGVGSKLIKHLAKQAHEKKYPRISCEVPKNNDAALKLLLNRGAINLSKEESWVNYEFSGDAVKKMLKPDKVEVENVLVRPAEPKDCVQIREMIQELADFEKMSDGPLLTVKDLQRDGFYKLYPEYYSFVAELTDPESGHVEIIGFSILFLTFDPIIGKRVHLEDFYVTPKHRGKRIGEMLFLTVAQFVDAGGYQGFTLEVLEWNTKAMQFYDKFGGTNLTLGDEGKESIRFKRDAIARLASPDK